MASSWRAARPEADSLLCVEAPSLTARQAVFPFRRAHKCRGVVTTREPNDLSGFSRVEVSDERARSAISTKLCKVD